MPEDTNITQGADIPNEPAADTGADTAQSVNPSGEQQPEKMFTQEDLNRIGSQEKRKAENSLLKKLGVEKMDDLQAVVETLAQARKAQQEGETPDQTIIRINSEMDALRSENAALAAKLAAADQRDYLKGKVDDADIPMYQAYINQLAGENGVSFEEAAEDYLKTRPKKQDRAPAAVTFGDTGQTPLYNKDKSTMTYEELCQLAEFKKG